MKSIRSPHTKKLTPARPLRASLDTSGRSSASNTSVVSSENGNKSINESYGSEDDQPMPVLNSITLKTGTTHDIFVSHVENGPKKFFIHLKNYDYKLETMMSQIDDSISELKNLTKKPAIGMAVLARYSEDLGLYRAVIQNIFLDACQVVFADYGNTELVNMENIFDIPQKFLQHKTFAMGFCLSKIKTITYDGDIDQIFKELVLDKELKMKVVPIDAPTFVQNCELYLDQMNVNIFDEILLRTKPVALMYPPCIDLPEGSSTDVVIRFVKSVRLFYVQPYNLENECNMLMEKLGKILNEKNEQLRVLKIREPCAVVWEGEWFRGEIVEIIHPKVNVKLIDYGYCIEIQKENVRCLPSELINNEPLVVQCCLTGFENVLEDCNSTTQLEMLAEANDGGRKVFRMQILKREKELYVVNLFDDSNTTTLDVSKRLWKLKNPVTYTKNLNNVKQLIGTPMNSTLINESTGNLTIDRTTDSLEFTSEDMSGSFQTPMNQNINRFSIPKKTPRPDIPRFNAMNRLQLNNSNGSQDTTMSTSGFNSQATNNELSKVESFKSSSSSIESVENYAPLTEKYTKAIIPMNLKVPVTLLSWYTPQNFFIKLNSDEENFTKMMKDLQRFYKQRKCIDVQPAEQSNVVVKNKDGLYYRATVIAYNEEMKKYRVSLIDFGKKIVVTINEIYRVDKRFFGQAAMAIECSLQEVTLAVDAKKLLDNLDQYIPTGANIECTFLTQQENTSIATVIVGGVDLKMHLMLENQIKQEISDIDLHRLKGQTIKIKLVEVNNMEKLYAKLCGHDALLKCRLAAETENSTQLLDTLKTTINDYSVSKIDDVTEDGTLIIKPILPQYNKKDLPAIPDMPMLMDKTKVGVSFVESVGCLYVQNEKWTDEIAKLLDDMFEFYERKGENLEHLAINEICAAKSSEDQNWYRAKVTFIHSIDDIEVYYIDYGNKERIKHCDLKVLDPSFMEFGAFAQKVFLPMKCSNDEKNLEVLKELRNLTSDIIIDLHVLDLKDDKWLVDVIINGNSIIDVLMSKWQEIEKIPLDEMFKNTAASVPTKFVIVEESDINSNTSEPCSLIEENDVANNNIDLKKRHTAIISHCDTPNQIFIQMKNDLGSLESMQEDLQIVAISLKPLTDFSLNRYCVAKYSGDDLWYRAKIIDSHEDLIVQFIDYGNTDVITSNKKNELKEIPDCYMKKKGYSKQCALLIGPFKEAGQWSESTVDYFRDIIDEVDIEFIAETKNISYIKMFLGGKDITEKLVEDEMAVRWQYVPSDEKCFTSHIYNLSEFYVQLEKDVTVLEMMVAHLEDENNFTALENPEVGMYCVAKYTDGVWYRAKIIAVLSPDEYEVLFLDYGNNSNTKEIRKLNDVIAKQRQLCTKCTLKLPDNIKYWSPAAEEKFLELTAYGETILTVNLVTPGPKATVELFLEGKNIAEELMQLCEEGIDHIMNSSVYSTDDKAHLDHIHGEKVLICHANGPNDFYIHFGTDGIRNMEELLANNANKYQQMLPNDIIIGKLCIVQEPESAVYYRAVVIAINENDYKVNLMDYGSTLIVKELKRMPNHLADMEFLAAHCNLETFEHEEDSVTSEIKAKFLKMANKKVWYDFEIVKDSGQLTIRLFNENDENLVDLLKKAGK